MKYVRWCFECININVIFDFSAERIEFASAQKHNTQAVFQWWFARNGAIQKEIHLNWSVTISSINKSIDGFVSINFSHWLWVTVFIIVLFFVKSGMSAS